MKEYTINRNDAEQRLDRFVSKTVPSLPASLAQKYIRIKRIKVNGKGAAREYKLVVDDVVQMYVNDEFFDAFDEENAYLKITDPNLEIVYDDENIMLVNKPAGMLCHADASFDYSSVSSAGGLPLISIIQAYLHKNGEWFPRSENSFTPALCNRIDRNTSGIVIAAKNAEALRIINEKLKQQEIDRYYLAVVHGIPVPQSARLEGYIFKDAVKNRVFVTKNNQPGAKSAVMEYSTLAVTDLKPEHISASGKQHKLALLQCRLFTGRTHQIRAQLANAGYPILGDGKYGNGKLDKPLSETKQALCSYKLIFNFKTDAGILEYLNGQEFKLDNITFAKKYFK